MTEQNRQNKEFKKEMLDRHRAVFDLWSRVATTLEEVVARERAPDSAFARALDLFFIQAFKSHQSLYLLCVHGLGEDAATIARRLFEIALQVEYLCLEQAEREHRGEAYLAHYWHNAERVLAMDLPQAQRKWWENQYQQHKHLLTFDKHGNPVSFWFDSSFLELAKKLQVRDTYEKDYRFLSHVAHCSSRGILLDKIGDKIEINSDRLVPAILIAGTKYALAVAEKWNEQYALIDSHDLKKLIDEAIES
jgi:Family of unknown function (DUF5677)